MLVRSNHPRESHRRVRAISSSPPAEATKNPADLDHHPATTASTNAPVSPTEKTFDPNGGNLFAPQVKAPAPSEAPGVQPPRLLNQSHHLPTT
jgi:hypothetical protein